MFPFAGEALCEYYLVCQVHAVDVEICDDNKNHDGMQKQIKGPSKLNVLALCNPGVAGSQVSVDTHMARHVP